LLRDRIFIQATARTDTMQKDYREPLLSRSIWAYLCASQSDILDNFQTRSLLRNVSRTTNKLEANEKKVQFSSLPTLSRFGTSKIFSFENSRSLQNTGALEGSGQVYPMMPIVGKQFLLSNFHKALSSCMAKNAQGFSNTSLI
jgi:hypothetical protein